MKFVKESFPCRSGAVCQLFPNHLMQDCYNEKKKKKNLIGYEAQ